MRGLCQIRMLKTTMRNSPIGRDLPGDGWLCMFGKSNTACNRLIPKMIWKGCRCKAKAQVVSIPPHMVPIVSNVYTELIARAFLSGLLPKCARQLNNAPCENATGNKRSNDEASTNASGGAPPNGIPQIDLLTRQSNILQGSAILKIVKSSR